MLLRVENITVCYGPVTALEDVSFEIASGEIVALVGPNGAGKSTALKAVAGLLPEFGGTLTSGTVSYDGQAITGRRPDQLAAAGIAVVPEGRRIFPSMTVRENLEIGGYLRRKMDSERMDAVFDLFPRLKECTRQRAGTLSTGEQQMLALGRALMLGPKLLLADEPSVGLSPNYVVAIFEKLRAINATGTSILIIEQNVRMSLEIAHRGYVFDVGRVALHDKAADLLINPQMKRFFLGKERGSVAVGGGRRNSE